MFLIDKPVHKLSKHYGGTWLVKERVNLWNYIVLVRGENKIVNITKIKIYHPNKYSKVDKERQLSSSEYKENIKNDQGHGKKQ